MVAITPDYDAILGHLSTLYGAADEGYLALWSNPSRHTEWVSVEELERAAAYAAQLAQREDVYCGVALHPAPLGPYARGLAGDVIGIPGLWAEIDIAGDGHKAASLPLDIRSVQDLVRSAVALPPSYVVASGGGVHVYWLFKEVWRFDDAGERQHASRLNRALQWLLIDKGRKRGWHIDSTSDLSRVLRPAGTLNRKIDPERPVRVLHASAGRYSVEDLERVLPLDDPAFPRHAPRDPNTPKSTRAPAALWGRITAQCAYMRHSEVDAATLSEPEWHAAMTMIGRCHNGAAIAHRVSAPYPGYDQHETDRKYAFSLAADAPMRCETIRYHRGGEPWCSKCSHWGKIASPIQLGYVPGYRYAEAPRAGEEPRA